MRAIMFRSFPVCAIMALLWRAEDDSDITLGITGALKTMNEVINADASPVDAVGRVRRALTRDDYQPGLSIISKRGRKAYVTTPCFHVLGKDAGWWCNQTNERYSKRWRHYQTRIKGFLLRYEDFKDWFIREEA